ncbi:MAG: hypothetical protein HYV26_02535 [Candidatus Hydrogenedentes bacterium]|nr:hypothetical protein [Candidatus Hydrogenedentota bacterium]
MKQLAVVLVLSLQAVSIFAEPLDIGSRRELFVDRFLIDSLESIQFRLHEPVGQNTAISFDNSWEGRYCAYVTVFRDGDRIRLYYRGLPEAGKDGSAVEVTCYAESSDGITFTKPNLGLYEVMGTRDNNVVLAAMPPFSHNFAPFLDTRPGTPEDQRYKAIAGTSETGLIPFASADGLHWQKTQDTPVLAEGAFDSHNVAFWSEHEQLYLCYFRTWTETSFGGFRTVSRGTSPDFVHWTAPVKMEFGDTPMEHLYTNETAPYFRAPHLYVAIAARFMPDRTVISEEEARALGVESNYWKDISDNVLMTSRGGNHYDRTFMEGFIRPGIGLEHWTSRTNYPAYGLVGTGEQEMSLYVQHAYGQPTAHLVRYALRPDGFISLNAPYSGGTMITKPLIFTGSGLYLNFSTSAAGFIKVEIQDETGAPIPGFNETDAAEMIGNELERQVRWKNGTDLSSLAGKPVRLHFIMKDADCYALQFK